MRIPVIALSALVAVAACDRLPLNSRLLGAPSSAESSGGVGASTAPLDATQGIAAPPETETTVLAPTTGPGFGGSATTVAGLGDPTIPGLWMETPLVTTPQSARVRSATGAEAILTLKPIAGEATAGSRLSIEAMRALGLPLTELAEVQVYPAS